MNGCRGNGIKRGRLLWLLALLIVAWASSATAQQSNRPDLWDGQVHSSISLYGWLPGLSATARYELPAGSGGGRAESKTDSNAFDSLSAFLMIQGDVRKGDWGLYGDFDAVKFNKQNSRFTSIGNQFVGADVGLDSRWGLKGGMVNLAGLYSLGHGRSGYVDLLFGMRYLWLKGNLSWDFGLNGNHGFDIANSGHIFRNTHVTDAIIGLRGRWYLGEGNWYVPYYVDVGAGNSDSTYQASVGLGYMFHWGDVSLDWRGVRYSQSGDNAFLRRLDLNGPSIKFTWNF